MRDQEGAKHHIAQTGWCWPGFLDQHRPVRSIKEASRLFLSAKYN